MQENETSHFVQNSFSQPEDDKTIGHNAYLTESFQKLLPYEEDFLKKNYKSEELNIFKEDILQLIRERDQKASKLVETYKKRVEDAEKNYDILTKRISLNYADILNSQASINSRLDKLNGYDAFVSLTKDQITSHEIRLTNMRTDFSKATQKYDQIYLDNLELPGYIGKFAKYKNCREFFDDTIKELGKLNQYKEKNTLDFKTYKEKLETIIKTFNTLVENNNKSQVKYINELSEKNHKDCTSMIEQLNEKIMDMRMENSKYSIELLAKSMDLSKEWDAIQKVKEEIYKNFQDKLNDFRVVTNNTLNSFHEFKAEFFSIKRKFLELAEFIKDVRFRKNIGCDVKKKEVKAIAKKITSRKIKFEEDECCKNKMLKQKMYEKIKENNSNEDEEKRNGSADEKLQRNVIYGNLIEEENETDGLLESNNSDEEKKVKVRESQSQDIECRIRQYINGEKNLMDMMKDSKKHNKKNIDENKKTEEGSKKTEENVPTPNNNPEKPAKKKKNIISQRMANIRKIESDNKNSIEENSSITDNNNCFANDNTDFRSSSTSAANIVNQTNLTTQSNSLMNTYNNNGNHKFAFKDVNIETNDKVIKELASELEQSNTKLEKLSNRFDSDNINKIKEELNPMTFKNINSSNSNNIFPLKENSHSSKRKDNYNRSYSLSYNVNYGEKINDDTLSNKMHKFDKKILELELYTKEKIINLISQIESLKNMYNQTMSSASSFNKKYDYYVQNQYNFGSLNNNNLNNTANTLGNTSKNHISVIEIGAKNLPLPPPSNISKINKKFFGLNPGFQNFTSLKNQEHSSRIKTGVVPNRLKEIVSNTIGSNNNNSSNNSTSLVKRRIDKKQTIDATNLQVTNCTSIGQPGLNNKISSTVTNGFNLNNENTNQSNVQKWIDLGKIMSGHNNRTNKANNLIINDQNKPTNVSNPLLNALNSPNSQNNQ